MEGAKIAFRSWRAVRVSEPSRYLQRYPQLLIQHHDELGELIRQDAGKIIKDAKDDVWLDDTPAPVLKLWSRTNQNRTVLD